LSSTKLFVKKLWSRNPESRVSLEKNLKFLRSTDEFEQDLHLIYFGAGIFNIKILFNVTNENRVWI